jgi:hypothetical protein
MTSNPKEFRTPLGKHGGKTVPEVLGQDLSYLAWFHDTVDGNAVLKRAIHALAGFCPPNGRHTTQQARKRAEEPDLPNLEVDPSLSREDLDRLCREILAGE